MKFKYSSRNWVEYRAELPNMVECDFHWTNEPMSGLYHENMQAVWNRALQALADAQANGNRYVLFTHGRSTSGIGKTTARSQVRRLMRSKEATPYLLRRDCIEQDSVFIAAIRPTKASAESAVVVEAERLATTTQPEEPPSKPTTREPDVAPSTPKQSPKIPTCTSCGTGVSLSVMKQCVLHQRARTGGKIYCIDCLMKISMRAPT